MQLLIALVLVASCGYGQTATTKTSPSGTPAISISVTPPSGPVHLGSTIPLEIVVKNISGRPIDWVAFHYNTAYRAFNVLLEQKGLKAKKTFLHRRLTNEQRPEDPPGVEDSDTTLSQIQPGESITFTLELTKLYQITEPGIYTLDVSRFDDTSKTTVHAKPVTLEIIP